MGFWKRKPVQSLALFDNSFPGSVAGEGAAFFLLETEKKPTAYALLQGTEMIAGAADPDTVIRKIPGFLAAHGLIPGDIDLLVAGLSGDPAWDKLYAPVMDKLFPLTPVAAYKHLCGEYFTSTGFATWLAARILKAQRAPEIVLRKGSPKTFRNILIYNHFRGINHSLILLSNA
jgi:3-oxoacyl-(acyl-carrier-protein) synthase